jgi:hypothetical protein
MAGNSKGKGASKDQEDHRFIAEHHMVFEGPKPSEKWPPQYANIFREVHEIDRVRYNEYDQNEKRDLLTVSEMKRKALDLTTLSFELREDRENEDTWRLETEPVIVSRFELDVVWYATSYPAVPLSFVKD